MNYFMMRLTLAVAGHFVVQVIILTKTIQADLYSCSCSCCLGQNCVPILFNNLYLPYCTTDSCLQICRNKYYQCQATVILYGQANAQCSSVSIVTPSSGPYSCQCNCCNSGLASCTPVLVGYTTAYSCNSGSCSIACLSQYPNTCISNQYGQTQGTCLGLTTTSTSTTTTGPWLGNGCSCYCCQSGPYCSPTVSVGNTSALQCSTRACTQECRNRYPVLCPSASYFGQSIGQCSAPTSGNTRCRCNCCGTLDCKNYYVYTDADCTSCYSMCQQYTQCVNSYQIIQLCDTNSTALRQFSFGHFQLILIPILHLFVPIV